MKMKIVEAEILNLNNNRTYKLNINSPDQGLLDMKISFFGRWLILNYDSMVKKISMRYVYSLEYGTDEN